LERRINDEGLTKMNFSEGTLREAANLLTSIYNGLKPFPVVAFRQFDIFSSTTFFVFQGAIGGYFSGINISK